MLLKFKRLHPLARMPLRASNGACAFDLFAVDMVFRRFGWYWLYDSGIAIELPPGYCGKVLARSSVITTGAIPTMGEGLIDADYRGSIHFAFTAEESRPPYQVGERFAQLLIQPCAAVDFEEAEELTATDRGAGCFGSTGK